MVEKEFKELVDIVKLLRKKCPWDKIQTNESIKAATLEEAYETVEAIDENNYDELKKELGDLLLHVLFHTIIAEEENKFTLLEVINLEKEKLIRRHPHIFGNLEVNDHNEVKRNWEKIKLNEGRKSIVDGLPKDLPALLKAYRIQEKVAKIGFEWTNIREAFDKIKEELEEMSKDYFSNNKEKLEEEIGDFLFAVVNFSRLQQVNAENALRKANEKFIKRFKILENSLRSEGKEISDVNKKELLNEWKKIKNEGNT